MTITATLQGVTHQIHQHILACGGSAREWYVGIANHTDRLFVDHRVSRKDDAWIFRTCATSADARAIEKAFHEWGCDGGPGGGGYDTVIVYAYRKTLRTVE